MSADEPKMPDAPEAPVPSGRTYASRGLVTGAGVGLLTAGRILSSIDTSVTDHSPIFSAAVMIVSVFALVSFFACATIGWLVGRCFKC